MPDLDIALRLRADARGLVGEVRLSKRELGRLGREAQRAGGRARAAQRLWGGFGREMEATRRRATGLRLAMTALATGVGVRVAGSFLRAASDAQELRSQFEAVFRGLTGEARQWAEAHADVVGRSSLDIEQYLATLQDTFVPLGFARREAFAFSRVLTQLGVDLASFKNAAEPETIDLLTSAIVGNHEAVRRFGVIITEATLNQELMNAGIAGGVRAADEQQKVLARLRIIIRSTADAQGDAARTADQHANRVRALTGDWRDFQVLFGSSLIPTARTGIQLLRELFGALGEDADPDALGREIERRFRSILVGGAAAADLLAAPARVARDTIDHLVLGFNRLPPWVQEIGILGAVLFGRRGRLILAGVAGISGLIDSLRPGIEGLETRLRALDTVIEGLEARRARGINLSLGEQRTLAAAQEERRRIARQVEAQRSADRLDRDLRDSVRAHSGGREIPEGFFSETRISTGRGGSLFGGGRDDAGESFSDQMERLLFRLDAARERSQRQGQSRGAPLALPAIPGTGATGIDDVIGSERGLREAERAYREFYREIAESHLEAVAAIEDAELDLATPYEQGVAEARHWRDETLATLDTTAEGYDDLAERVEAVYLERIAAAAEEAAERQREAAAEAQGPIEAGLRRYAAEALDANAQIADATHDAFGGMEDALVAFVTTGKLSFRGLVDSIVADLARIAVRQAITGPLAAALAGAFGGGGGFSPGYGSFPTSHAGGIAGRSRTIRHGVDPRVFTGAPRLHGGGIAGGEVPAILRRGEGVFTPEQLQALGGRLAAPVVVELNVENRGTPQDYRIDRSFTAEDGRRVVALIADDMARGGDTARAAEGRFGLAPAAGT